MPGFYDYSNLCIAREKIFSNGLYSPLKIPRILRIENSPILLSAPHAVIHSRDGESKLPDRGTGGLALALNEIAGVSCIVETSGIGDPAWDDSHDFKSQILFSPPKLIIDLHGMKDEQPTEVDVGLGISPSETEMLMANFLIRRCKSNDINATLGKRFKAIKSTTVTSWAQSIGIHAIQVEIGAKYRVPKSSDDNLDSFVEIMLLFLKDCEELV